MTPPITTDIAPKKSLNPSQSSSPPIRAAPIPMKRAPPAMPTMPAVFLTLFDFF